MKHIRNILLLITIIFAFVMQAEVYQNMLWNFNGAYYLSSRYTTTNDDMDSFLANAEDTAEKHGVHIFSTFNQRVSNYQTRLYIYGDDTVVRDSLKSTMDIEEKTYTALIGGITVIEFEDFREAKNTGNGQEIMVSYIGDDDDIIATYQDLAKEYSISQPEFWQSTETDMMFIVWGLVAILMIVLNMIEVIRRQKEVVVRASLGENAAVIALKAVVADMISYAALFVLAKLLVSQFISGAYEDHLILAVYCAGAVLSVIPYAAFVRFDVKKAFANASDKKGMFYLLNGLKVFATAMTIFTITILVLLALCVVRIVPQAYAMVIERLGGYLTTWNVGIHFKVPILDRVAKKVLLKEQVVDFAPQPVITKDNVTMRIDTVVFFQITDPKLFVYGVDNPIMAIENLTATTLRNIIGDLELDETLTSRETINTKMRASLDVATDPWGIKVNRVELKNIIPPQAIQDAMEKQMKAERERREAVTRAEGEKTATILVAQGKKESAILDAEAEKQAAILRAEAKKEATVREAEGQAEAILRIQQANADGLKFIKEAGADDAVLQLKSLEAFAKAADGKATKIIIPSEIQGIAGLVKSVTEVASDAE